METIDKKTYLLTGCEYGDIIKWELTESNNLKKLKTFQSAHDSWVCGITANSNSVNYFSGSADRKLRQWSWDDNKFMKL